MIVKAILSIKFYSGSVSWSVMPQPNSIAGNAKHGAQSSEPSENVCPPWVFVVQVFDRRPLYYIEEEHALIRIKEIIISNFILTELFLTMQISGVVKHQQNFHHPNG